MARISDITIERTYTGHPTYIKFNYNKYAGLLQSFFHEHDIELPLEPNEVTKKAMKEAEQGKTKGFKSVAELLADLKE
jgi:hypothetical protein